VQAAPPLGAEAAGAQQAELEPAGGGKKDKERQRKERQRQRKMGKAREALQAAMEATVETAGSVQAVEEATAEAEKHGDRSEQLAALVAEARGMLEQARAEQAERARAAAEEAAAAAVFPTGGGGGGGCRAAADGGGDGGSRAEATADLQAQLLRASGGTRAARRCRGDVVRAVPGRAQGPHHRALWFHQCVCEACAEKLEEGQKRSVLLAHRAQRHLQGVRSLHRLTKTSTAPTLLAWKRAHLNQSIP
jgi:hypothetical protein